MDAQCIDDLILIPGMAWWENADGERREYIKGYCMYWYHDEYGYPYEDSIRDIISEADEITPELEAKLESINPLWFSCGPFQPMEIINEVPYYPPVVYADDLGRWGRYDNYILPFEVEGKWGHVNEFTGKVEAPPIWDYTQPFDGYHIGYAGKRSGIGRGKPCDIRCVTGENLGNNPITEKWRTILWRNVRRQIRTHLPGRGPF